MSQFGSYIHIFMTREAMSISLKSNAGNEHVYYVHATHNCQSNSSRSLTAARDLDVAVAKIAISDTALQ